MVNNLKALIIHQIKEVFGNVKVYDERIKQGLKTPAFLVLIIDSEQETQIAKSVNRYFAFNVNYYPATDDVRSECDMILQTFQNEFRYIQDTFHVLKLNGSVVDDVLVMTFNVNVRLREVLAGIKMESIGGVSIDKRN